MRSIEFSFIYRSLHSLCRIAARKTSPNYSYCLVKKKYVQLPVSLDDIPTSLADVLCGHQLTNPRLRYKKGHQLANGWCSYCNSGTYCYFIVVRGLRLINFYENVKYYCIKKPNVLMSNVSFMFASTTIQCANIVSLTPVYISPLWLAPCRGRACVFRWS